MATYYADSSVLVKRHVAEVGTPWVQALTDPTAGHLFANGDPPLTFLAADDRLLTAAQREGLVVDNPHRHP